MTKPRTVMYMHAYSVIQKPTTRRCPKFNPHSYEALNGAELIQLATAHSPVQTCNLELWDTL